MNRILMLTAAALMTSVSAADAGKGQAVLSVDGMCNTYSFHWDHHEYGDVDSYKPCGLDKDIIGKGFIKKTRGLGKTVTVNDGGDPDKGYYYKAEFQLPFSTGKTVTYYYSTDGVEWTEFLNAIYTVQKTATGRLHGSKRLRDLIRATIAANADKN